MGLGDFASNLFGAKAENPKSAYGMNEAARDVGIERGHGDVARGRGAVRADFGASNAAYGQAGQDYQRSLGQAGNQQDAMGMMKAAAEGKTPSVAETQQRQGIEQSMQAQMAMAGSARGGQGLAAAQRAGAQQGAAMQQAGVNQSAQLRAQEMAGARGQFAGQANAMRGAEQAERGLSQQEAQQRGQLALGQGQLELGSRTQSAQEALGYENVGMGYHQQAVEGDLARMREEGANNRQNAQMNAKFGPEVISAAGDVAQMAAGLSDVRAKTDIHSAGDWVHAGGESGLKTDIAPAGSYGPSLSDVSRSRYASQPHFGPSTPESAPRMPGQHDQIDYWSKLKEAEKPHGIDYWEALKYAQSHGGEAPGAVKVDEYRRKFADTEEKKARGEGPEISDVGQNPEIERALADWEAGRTFVPGPAPKTREEKDRDTASVEKLREEHDTDEMHHNEYLEAMATPGHEESKRIEDEKAAERPEPDKKKEEPGFFDKLASGLGKIGKDFGGEVKSDEALKAGVSGAGAGGGDGGIGSVLKGITGGGKGGDDKGGDAKGGDDKGGMMDKLSGGLSKIGKEFKAPEIKNMSDATMTSDERSKSGKKKENSPVSYFLDNIHPYSYRYKDPVDDPTHEDGRKRVGIMAQDADRSAVGHSMVDETERGKAFNMKAATSVTMASLADLNARLRKLEGKGKK